MKLTSREIEIMRMVADGMESPGIGKQLGIKPHTVHTHMGNIHKKLDTHTLAAAVAKMFRLGLLK